MVIVSNVTFSNGTSTQLVITGVSAGQSDHAHHAHQRDEARFWASWKRVTGGSYQAFDDLVGALCSVRPARHEETSMVALGEIDALVSARHEAAH